MQMVIITLFEATLVYTLPSGRACQPLMFRRQKWFFWRIRGGWVCPISSQRVRHTTCWETLGSAISHCHACIRRYLVRWVPCYKDPKLCHGIIGLFLSYIYYFPLTLPYLLGSYRVCPCWTILCMSVTTKSLLDLQRFNPNSYDRHVKNLMISFCRKCTRTLMRTILRGCMDVGRSKLNYHADTIQPFDAALVNRSKWTGARHIMMSANFWSARGSSSSHLPLSSRSPYLQVQYCYTLLTHFPSNGCMTHSVNKPLHHLVALSNCNNKRDGLCAPACSTFLPRLNFFLS